MSHVTQGAELGLERAMVEKDRWLSICSDVLDSAREQDYAGYSKFDALNSPLVLRLCFNNKWLRLLFTQVVNHSPLHLRPLLRVRKSRNPKGIALFVRAYLFLWHCTGENRFRIEAEKLLQWLQENRATGTKHAAWGYNFIWQNTIFLQQAHEPNCVVTVFAAEAFIHAYRSLGKEQYLQTARDAARFIMKDLPVLYDGSDEKAIGYVLRGNDSIVLNINALAGAFLVKVWKETREKEILDFAQRLLAFTVGRRTDYDAWYYTYPKEKSPITHDNYHTGGILDALLEYFETTGDEQYMPVYWNGLEFYRTRLFESDGAARWMHDKKYPFDIHGSAQGIISFAKAAEYRALYGKAAEYVASWAVANLYRPETRDFAYRQGRFLKWNYSLMRWCNAWMARGLAQWHCYVSNQCQSPKNNEDQASQRFQAR